MKLLIENIKLALEQLNDEALRQRLLNNFNSKTHFPLIFSEQNSLEFSDFIKTILSELSIQQQEHLSHVILEQTKKSLKDLASIWNLVNQLIKQPHALIKLLQAASPLSLAALQQLNLSKDWNNLIEVFLDKGLQTNNFNKREIINFLRQCTWLEELKTWVSEVEAIYSLGFQLQLFISSNPSSAYLESLSLFCQEQPFALDALTLNRVLTFSVAQLSKEDSLLINKGSILLLNVLLKKLNPIEQKAIIKKVQPEELRALITCCIEQALDVEDLYRDAYKQVLYLVCTQSSDSNERDVIQRQLCRVENRFSSYKDSWFSLLQVQDLNIEKLLLRFRGFIFTLKPHELIAFINPSNELANFYHRLLSQLLNIEEKLTQTPEQINLLAQKERLIDWCAKRAAHALLAELLRQARQHNNPQVLTALYSYYFQHFFPLRGDLREAVFQHFYGMSFAERGDFDPYVYNQHGQCIAFVDEANQTWSLVTEPRLLNATNEKNQNIFIPTHLKSKTKESPIAQFISLRTIEELERFPIGLSLLIDELLVENSFVRVCQKLDIEKQRLKHAWLLKRIVERVAEVSYPLPVASLDSLLSYMPMPKNLALLARFNNYNVNALSFFHRLILNNDCRKLLFSDAYPREAHEFFIKHKPVVVLSDYLQIFYKKPWFLQGLTLFAAFAQSHKQQTLFTDSLSLVQKQVPMEQFDYLLTSLIASQNAIEIVIQEFISDDLSRPVQEVENSELEQLCSNFNKQHLLYLIRRLNASTSCPNDFSYRLCLHFFHQDQKKLPKLIGQLNREELCALSLFINRHLSDNNSWDRNLSLGFKVLGYLIYYCSAAGQTNLFLKAEGTLNRLSAFSASPLMLKQLASNIALQRGQTESAWEILIASPYYKELKNIPLMCFFLLQYQGPVVPLEELLVNYLIAYAGNPALIHPITALLLFFPERALSTLIFSCVQKVLSNNPKHLDSVIFAHLAEYYSQQQGISTKMDSMDSLLRSWGQSGDFSLTQAGCTILQKNCEDKALKQKLIKAELELKVEKELQELSQVDSIYSNIIIWCKRIWNYGFQWQKTRSQFILFANEIASPLNSAFFYPNTIMLPKAVIIKKSNQNNEVLAFINLLAEIVRSAARKPEQSSLGEKRQVLFNIPRSSVPNFSEASGQEHAAHV